MVDEEQPTGQEQPASEDPAAQAAGQDPEQDPEQPADPGADGGGAKPGNVWQE